MKVFNTLGRKKEELKLIDKNMCKIYSCGPTVYGFAHIGNFRTYLFVDLLRRTVKYSGINIFHVMNITDVGHLVSDADYGVDKMLKAARLEKKSPFEIARFYEKAFLSDMYKLNIDMPEKIVRATEHIQDMEKYVKDLLEKGFAYETKNTVYFDTSKLENYGILSNIEKDKLLEGARVEKDLEKRNSTDFAIWIKAPENHIMKWDSFFGKSYPGWHLECSVMSEKYLGNKFDIHTGGIDHIQIHHENEIAQCIGHNGHIPANYWMHSEFLTVDNGKMSKSLGNTYTIRDLEERGFSALDFKYYNFNTHYRNKMNFTFEALNGAKKALIHYRTLYLQHKNSDNINEINLDIYINRFKEYIFDDLNVTKALGVVWEVLKLDKNQNISKFIEDVDDVLGLNIKDSENILKTSNEETFDIPAEIKNLLIKRKEARENKDFNLSDQIREAVRQMGYNIIDLKEEQKLEKI